MEWHQVLGIIIGALGLFWGGWKSFKHVPREVGEALIAFGDMIADNVIKPEEWRRFMKECRDVQEVVGKLMLNVSLSAPGFGKSRWSDSLFRLLIDLAFMLNKWQSEKDRMPPPPKVLGTISARELRQVLKDAGITKGVHLGSAEYQLTSVQECQPFLDWYRDKTDYELDGYDCNVFALVKHAAAAKWMKGLFVWGHIWAKSADENYPFPSHGFDIMVDHNRKVYFSDELEMAAPSHRLEEAYEVDSNLTEI